MVKSFFEKLTSSIKAAREELEEPKKAKVKRVDFKEGEEGFKKGLELKVRPERNLEQTIEPEKPEGSLEEPKPEEPRITYPEVSSKEEGQLTIDVYQTEKDIVIKSTIAGVSSEDLDIEITNDMVTIKGVRPKDEEIPQENYFYQECYWGPFSRTIILPQDILADQAQASMKNGILIIRLPKAHAVITRKLKVKASV